MEYQLPKYSKYGYGSSFYDKYDYSKYDYSQYEPYNKYGTSSFDSKHVVEGYEK